MTAIPYKQFIGGRRKKEDKRFTDYSREWF
jgi:hypothetical protein